MSVKQGDFSAQASGRYQGAGDGTPEGDDGWMVGGGIGYSAGLVSAEVGAATGRGMARDFTTFDLSGFDVLGSDFMAANALLTLRMSETTHLEGFMGHATLDPSSGIVNAGAPESLTGFGGGVFWTPAAQLTLGAGASWSKTTYDTDADEDLANKHETTVGLGAWFSF